MLTAQDLRKSYGAREVVIWDSDEELTKSVERVALKADRVVIDVSRSANR